jgi:hypothetical protein
VDEETARFIAIRKIKLDRLYELDRQAAAFGEYNAPPHIQMERTSLRDELGMMESAINSPARAEVGDELGPAGRFLVYHQQNREIKQSIAALAVEFEKFVSSSQEWRAMHRNWILLIGLVVILILIAVVALVTYLFTRGAL